MMKKCADYFPAESGVRIFGKICVSIKSIKTTKSSLVLRSMEVKYKDVSINPHYSLEQSAEIYL